MAHHHSQTQYCSESHQLPGSSVLGPQLLWGQSGGGDAANFWNHSLAHSPPYQIIDYWPSNTWDIYPSHHSCSKLLTGRLAQLVVQQFYNQQHEYRSPCEQNVTKVLQIWFLVLQIGLYFPLKPSQKYWKNGYIAQFLQIFFLIAIFLERRRDELKVQVFVRLPLSLNLSCTCKPNIVCTLANLISLGLWKCKFEWINSQRMLSAWHASTFS